MLPLNEQIRREWERERMGAVFIPDSFNPDEMVSDNSSSSIEDFKKM